MSSMEDGAGLGHTVRVGLNTRAGMRLGAALGLLFLTGPAVDLARESTGDVRRSFQAGTLALFVALYVSLLPPAPWVVRPGRRWPEIGVAALVALATALSAIGAPGSFVALYVYAVAASGLLLGPYSAAGVISIVTVGVGAGLVATGANGSAAAAILLTIVTIGVMTAAFGSQVRRNRQLRSARNELARLAVTEERLRIARDVHDLLGHTLSVIALKTELAAKLVARDATRAVAELDEVQVVTRHALAEVREAVHSYRHLGLDEALAGARAQLEAAGIEPRLDESEVSLPDDAEGVLAWAVREGVTNVVRHSHARHCAIRLSNDGAFAAVEIEDDGSATGGYGDGSGLAGLAERAERMRGRLEASALPAGGFRLLVSVPLTPP
jgi:two-component system sensor histidine kinase DesK